MAASTRNSRRAFHVAVSAAGTGSVRAESEAFPGASMSAATKSVVPPEAWIPSIEETCCTSPIVTCPTSAVRVRELPLVKATTSERCSQ